MQAFFLKFHKAYFTGDPASVKQYHPRGSPPQPSQTAVSPRL